MLKIENLVVRYGSFLALQNVNAHVERGEIIGIIGANGAGKSTLVRAIAGLVLPEAGTITFCGDQLIAQPPQDRTKLGLSLVPEGRGLFPRMSVEENLMLGGYLLKDKGGMRRNLERSFELFPILRERRRQMSGTLSGGQQQMLAMSMGLMSDPQLMILDEPSLGLAPIVIGEIAHTLSQMKQAGLTTLLIEQNSKMTATVADRIYVLQSGGIRYHDTPDNLFSNPEVAESFLSM
jgi:branched-chain amino acid transport system ATP-binding protein